MNDIWAHGLTKMATRCRRKGLVGPAGNDHLDLSRPTCKAPVVLCGFCKSSAEFGPPPAVEIWQNPRTTRLNQLIT